MMRTRMMRMKAMTKNMMRRTMKTTMNKMMKMQTAREVRRREEWS